MHSAGDRIPAVTTGRHRLPVHPSEPAGIHPTAREVWATSPDEFELGYELRFSIVTGRPIGAEAIVRKPRRRRGMSPSDNWPLRAACRDAGSWPAGSVISLPIGGRGGEDGLLIAQLARALGETGLGPEQLEIMLPEAGFADMTEERLLALAAIEGCGVGLGLDDAGLGLGGLAMLGRLPFTSMKLDRSLVRGLPEDEGDRAILRSLVQAGHAFGLTIIADGIEAAAQLGCLVDLGVELGQGALFGPPLPAAGIGEWLRKKHLPHVNLPKS